MDREQAQAEFDHLMRPYIFAPGCGDHTPRSRRTPSPPAAAGAQPLSNEAVRDYPGTARPRPGAGTGVLGPEIMRDGSSSPSRRSPTFGNDVERSYSAPEPVCPPRREPERIGQRSTSSSRDEALYDWVFQNVVREVVFTAEQVAAMHSDSRVGVSSWMAQSYREVQTPDGVEITMALAALVQGRAPAEVYNVVARRRGHQVQVTTTRGSNTVLVSGLERTERGVTIVSTTSRLRSGSPSSTRGLGGTSQQRPVRPH